MNSQIRTVVLLVVALGIGGTLYYQKMVVPSGGSASKKVSKKTTPKRSALENKSSKSLQPEKVNKSDEVSVSTESDNNPDKQEDPQPEVSLAPETKKPTVAASEAVEKKAAKAKASKPVTKNEPTPAKESAQTIEVPKPSNAGMRGRLFIELDADKSQSLAETELPKAHRKNFARSDKDGDGQLSFIEFYLGIAEWEASGKAAESAATVAETKPAIPVHAEQADNKTKSPDWFRQLDKDKDQQVGLYEWKSRKVEEFRRLDRNNDGFIVLEEALNPAPAKSKSQE